MKKNDRVDPWVKWVEGFPWQWSCTLAFRPGLTRAQSRWRMMQWLEELREELGTAEMD